MDNKQAQENPLATPNISGGGVQTGLVSADGALWTWKKEEQCGQGGYSSQKVRLFRNNVEVCVVEDSQFIQSNPDMSGAVTHHFRLSEEKKFEIDRTVNNFDREEETSRTVMVWDGETITYLRPPIL